MRVTVTLNGSPTNGWHRYGLRCNPFPQIPDARFNTANRMLQELDSNPLESTAQIRTILSGCDPEFIELCCARFVSGQRVQFDVEWPS